MPWSTVRETLIRRYCPAVADDSVNWPDSKLQDYFYDAFVALKSRLCPPFDGATFDTLHSDSTHTDSGNRLIARFAAYLIYIDLPDTDPQDDAKRESFIDGIIERLQKGEDTIYLSTGAAIEPESALYHTHEDVEPQFSMGRTDKNTGQIISTGSLDQH